MSIYMKDAPGVQQGPTIDVLFEVAEERKRQVEKWGEQRHPDGTGPTHGSILETGFSYDADAQFLKDQCDRLHQSGLDRWDVILTEEVFEAFAEEDPAKLRAELIQVAAVAVAWVEDLDSRTAVGE